VSTEEQRAHQNDALRQLALGQPVAAMTVRALLHTVERLTEERDAAEVDALRKAGGLLGEQAALRFETHGVHDARGAALWDAGCFIDPDDGAFGVTTRDGDA